MIRQHRTLAQGCAVLVTAAFLATGCSSSKSTGSGSTGGAATTTTTAAVATTTSASGGGGGAAPTDAATATQSIKDMWVKYFDSSIPQSEKGDLVQNPSKMGALVDKLQAAAGASKSSATVNSVTFSSPTFAKVDFAILLAGKTVLPSAQGQAILDSASGKWQVADTTLCQLATLDGIDKATTTAAGCP